MARSHRLVRSSGPKRTTEWSGLNTVFSTMGSAQAVLVGSLDAAELATRPFTIIRIRGHILIRSDQQASVENFVGAAGLCVVSDQALAVGVTAVPTPTTDQESDLWFWYGQYCSTNVVDAGGSLLSLPFDSKAMRKVNADQDVAVVIENPLATGVVMGITFRMLRKLH